MYLSFKIILMTDGKEHLRPFKTDAEAWMSKCGLKEHFIIFILVGSKEVLPGKPVNYRLFRRGLSLTSQFQVNFTWPQKIFVLTYNFVEYSNTCFCYLYIKWEHSQPDKNTIRYTCMFIQV